MACASLTTLLNTACGTSAGGALELYAISYADTIVPADGVGTNHYVKSATGLISEIGLATGKTFVQIGFYKNTAGLSEELTSDITKGSAFYTTTLVFNLQMSNDEKTLVQSLANNPVIVIYKTRNGNFYTAGLSGELCMSSNSRSLGTTAEDSTVSTITLSGIDSEMITEIDATIISTLLGK